LRDQQNHQPEFRGRVQGTPYLSPRPLAGKLRAASLNPYSNAVIAKTNSAVVAFPFEFLEIADVNNHLFCLDFFNDLFGAVEKSSIIIAGL